MKLKGTVTSIVPCAYVLGTLINKISVSVVRIPVIRLRFMCPPWTGRSGVCARVGRKPRVTMERNERHWGIPLLLLVGPVKGARHNPTATGRTWKASRMQALEEFKKADKQDGGQHIRGDADGPGQNFPTTSRQRDKTQ